MKNPVLFVSMMTPLTLLASGALPTRVHAEEATKSDYYSEMRVGANFVEDAGISRALLGRFRAETAFDTGPTIGIAFGREASFEGLSTTLRNLRFEGEFAYDQSDFDTAGQTNAELTSTRFMANVLHQWPLSGRLARLSPYVGGGIGVALVEADGAGLSDNDDTIFVYQVRAGVSYALNPELQVSVGYRYLGAEDPTFGDASGRFSVDYRAHAAELGLRYDF